MYTLFVILIVIAAVLMIGIVLIQESKGGGLSSSVVFARPLTSSRRPHGVSLQLWWSSALFVLGLLLQLLLTAQ